MIRDAVIDRLVIPSAIDEIAPYIIVGTIAAVMFIGYHFTNGVERRLKERRR